MRMLGFFAVCVGCFLGGCTATRHWDGPEVEALIDGGGAVESGMYRGMPYIMASVNGAEPMKFLFDTGAGFNIFTPEAAKELGIKRDGYAHVRGASGKTKPIIAATIDRVEFGPVSMGDMVFLIHDLREVSPYFADEIAGIIGYRGLEAYTIDIDYPNRRLAITDERLDPRAPDTSVFYRDPFGLQWVPISFVDPDSPKHTRMVWCMLDTGNIATFDLVHDAAEPLLDYTRASDGHESIGIHGIKEPKTMAPLRAGMLIGQTRIEGVNALLNDVENRLSSNLLRNFRIRIDGKSQLVSFTRADNARRLVSIRRMGITNLSSFDGYRIDRVIKGSPAYLMGIRAYDKVLLIDGHEPTAIHNKAPYWAADPDTTTITVRIHRKSDDGWVDVVLPIDGSVEGIEEKEPINEKPLGIEVEMTGTDGEVIRGIMTPVEPVDKKEQAAP
jgi:Aspartyl protease